LRRLILGIAVSILAILFIPYIIVPAYAEPYITVVITELGFNMVEADNETFPGGCYEITLYAEFAAYRDENNLSYYELGTDTYTLIFDGPEGGNEYIIPPLTRTFVASSEFGLSMVTPEGHRYYTETDKNPDAPEQHAKVYKDPEEPCMFLIGFENLYGGGDRDYNDIVFSLELCTPEQVIPEVPFGTILSCLIMFVGFIGFVGFKRFRPWQK
jgi:hypothetical protein